MMADETTTTNTPATTGTEQLPGLRDGKPVMAVKVYAPFQIYFEGEAYSVSAVNATGPFDILPRHHDFLCMLVPCTLSIQIPQGKKDIKISRALMHVKADRVVVFVDV